MKVYVMWNSENLLLHFELSTRCNAYCPGCPRYINNSRVLNPLLEQTNVSIDDYMRWVPPHTLRDNVRRVMFCGNYGDPIANPDIVEIIKYTVRNLRDDAYIVINTNGGLGSVKQWKEIGISLRDKPRHTVFFSVDGLEDTNHIYRREVLWKRIDENIRAYTQTGAYGEWDYLVFQHNKHQKAKAELQCKEWGLHKIRWKDPMGFYWNGKHHTRGVYDKQGNLEYKLSTRSNAIDEVNITTNISDPIHSTTMQPQRKFTCKSLQSWGTELMIHVDGTVYPCCYMGDLVNRYVVDPSRQEIKDLLDRERLSLNTNSIDDVCGYFSNTLWKKFTPQICLKECGHD